MKLLLSLVFVTFFSQVAFAEFNIENSVIKVYATKSKPDYKYPWQTNRISNSSGSGAIIEDNMILTAAHVISHASYIEVKKEGSPKRFKAEVKYISHQADLAVLEVVDETFFVGTRPLKLNHLVKHRDAVSVYGYPLGGDSIAITEGVISRIEYQKYVYSKESLLAIQIDAAINSGNSGGPAINNNGELVGIAMQGFKRANSIGYIVPSILIQSFIDDIQDQEVNGFHLDQNVIKAISNSSMKQYYGLDNGDGVLVTATQAGEKLLKTGDVLLAVDGMPIANDGSIDSKMGRTDYSLIFHKKQVGDSVNLRVLRNKQEMDIVYPLSYTKPLIATELNRQPRYYLFGGLAFTPMTNNYLNSIDMKDSAIDMLFYGQLADKDLLEPVVLMQTIFPHEVNRGYLSSAYIVGSVNEERVKSFSHFIELIEDSSEKYITIDFLTNKKVILERERAIEAMIEIKEKFNLITDRRL